MEDAYVLQFSDRKFSDLYLCFCGYAHCEPLHSFGPAVRPNYIIHYVLSGRGRYYVGDQQYELSAGQGFLIEPEVQTFYQADVEDPWTYLWVGFSGNKAEDFLRDIGLNQQQVTFHCERGTELKMTVLNMLKNNTSSVSNQFLLQSLLYSFFAILTRDIEIPLAEESSGDNLYVRRALEYIQNNYSNGIKVTDIADYVCINRSYLYTLFRKNMDCSPQEYLANYRLTRARELLTLTDLPIEGVAMSCGYRDPLVFSKTFKLKYGIPPRSYREQNRKEKKEYLKQNKDNLEDL